MYGHVVFDLKNAAYFYGGGEHILFAKKMGLEGPNLKKFFSHVFISSIRCLKRNLRLLAILKFIYLFIDAALYQRNHCAFLSLLGAQRQYCHHFSL